MKLYEGKAVREGGGMKSKALLDINKSFVRAKIRENLLTAILKYYLRLEQKSVIKIKRI